MYIYIYIYICPLKEHPQTPRRAPRVFDNDKHNMYNTYI